MGLPSPILLNRVGSSAGTLQTSGVPEIPSDACFLLAFHTTPMPTLTVVPGHDVVLSLLTWLVRAVAVTKRSVRSLATPGLSPRIGTTLATACRVKVPEWDGFVEATAAIEGTRNTQTEISPVLFPPASITLLNALMPGYVADCVKQNRR